MAGTESENRGEIVGVQYMRALAAIIVVYFHTTVYNAQFAWPAGAPRGFGESGVDIFFVISGFIMVLVTARGTLSPGQFLYRRITRIVPLYWAVTLLVAVIGIVYPAGMLQNEVSFSHVGLSMLFLPHANPVTGSITPFYKLGWTLNYEMYFYVLFACLLFVRPIERRLAVLCAYALAVSVYFAIYDPQIAIWRVYTNPIIWEFVLGALVGHAYTSGWLRRVPLAVSVALVGLGLAVLFAVPMNDDIRLFRQGFASVALLVGVLGIETAGRMPNWRWLVLLGNASYSIYLVHPLVETAARIAAKTLRLPVESMAVGAPLVVAATVGSCIAGIVVYRVFEMPLMAWFKARGRKPAAGTAKSAALAASPLR